MAATTHCRAASPARCVVYRPQRNTARGLDLHVPDIDRLMDNWSKPDREWFMLKWLLVIFASAYLLGVAGFSVLYYLGHPEQGLFEAVRQGAVWPGILVDMITSPSL